MITRAEIPEFVLADQLREDVAFHGIAGDRIFHQGIPEGRGVKFPSVVIRLISGGEEGRDAQGISQMRSNIQFAIEDNDFGRCKEVANRLFKAVNGFVSTTTKPPIKRCRLTEGGETDDPILLQDGTFLYGVNQVYAVQWTR